MGVVSRPGALSIRLHKAEASAALRAFFSCNSVNSPRYLTELKYLTIPSTSSIRYNTLHPQGINLIQQIQKRPDNDRPPGGTKSTLPIYRTMVLAIAEPATCPPDAIQIFPFDVFEPAAWFPP